MHPRMLPAALAAALLSAADADEGMGMPSRYKRAIHVDVRYLRWLLAKVYPAPRLLEERALPAE